MPIPYFNYEFECFLNTTTYINFETENEISILCRNFRVNIKARITQKFVMFKKY